MRDEGSSSPGTSLGKRNIQGVLFIIEAHALCVTYSVVEQCGIFLVTWWGNEGKSAHRVSYTR